jgi:hypothetical protein
LKTFHLTRPQNIFPQESFSLSHFFAQTIGIRLQVFIVEMIAVPVGHKLKLKLSRISLPWFVPACRQAGP